MRLRRYRWSPCRSHSCTPRRSDTRCRIDRSGADRYPERHRFLRTLFPKHRNASTMWRRTRRSHSPRTPGGKRWSPADRRESSSRTRRRVRRVWPQWPIDWRRCCRGNRTGLCFASDMLPSRTNSCVRSQRPRRARRRTRCAGLRDACTWSKYRRGSMNTRSHTARIPVAARRRRSRRSPDTPRRPAGRPSCIRCSTENRTGTLRQSMRETRNSRCRRTTFLPRLTLEGRGLNPSG